MSNIDDEIVQAWAKEGRTPEQIHGVKNFLTSRHFKQLITDARAEAFGLVETDRYDLLTKQQKQHLIEYHTQAINQLRKGTGE